MNEMPSIMKGITIIIAFSFISMTIISCKKETNNPDEDNLDPVEVIWEDDFDDGQLLDDKYEDVSTNGMQVSTSDQFNGASSLRQTYSQGQVDAGWIIKVLDDGYPDHFFMRWYHKFETGFSGFPPKMARVRCRDRSNWTSSLGIHCWLNTTDENGGAVEIDIKAPHSSQANSSGWLAINRTNFTFADPANIGRWVCFELEVQLNTSGQTDGYYRLWIDDQLEAEKLNIDFRGTQNYKINEAMLDCYWNGGSPKEQSRYYDGFVISTEKIGMENN